MNVSNPFFKLQMKQLWPFEGQQRCLRASGIIELTDHHNIHARRSFVEIDSAQHEALVKHCAIGIGGIAWYIIDFSFSPVTILWRAFSPCL